MSVTGPEDRLVDWYRQYIGEPERRADVYLGFALFFGGLACGLVGLALFVTEQAVSGAEKLYWLREIAFAVGAFGLPALLVGVTVLLPVEQRARFAAGAGGAVCLAAIGFFLWAYPWSWDTTSGADYSMQGVAIYAVGLVTVVGATAAALVGYHVERVAPEAAEGADDGATADPEVTDEQVRQDIDEMIDDAEITWGGVRKDETRRIELSDGGDDGGLDTSGFDGVEATATRASGSGVDDAVAGLKSMQGEAAGDTARGSGTDDQAAALAGLREQKAAEEEESESAVGRLREWLTGRSAN
jgi:hypothetical protein